MYYLMIKEIEQTGLKYLCKRKASKNTQDHINYKGSGKLWRRILKAHPEYTIKTTVLGLYDKLDLEKYGLYYSNLYNIVKSKEWANLIPEIGDGGITHLGTHPYKNIKTGKIVYKSKCPKGFVPYSNIQKPTRVIHNPITGQIRKIDPNESTPDGWCNGGLKGKFLYGPKKDQTKVYHNGIRKIYVKHGDPVPDGFVPGLHYEGTTKGRIGCYNPITKEKKYIKNGEPIPEGFIRGLLPTTGKKLQTPYGIFDSISKCMEHTKLTRHAIQRRINEELTWFYIED